MNQKFIEEREKVDWKAVDFIADYRKHARVKRVPVQVKVERVHYSTIALQVK